jgi:hypothetical protein
MEYLNQSEINDDWVIAGGLASSFSSGYLPHRELVFDEVSNVIFYPFSSEIQGLTGPLTFS